MLDLRSTSSPWRKEATRLRRAHLDWVSPALLMDWLVIYALSRLADHLRSLQPYERDPGRYLNSDSLNYPRSAKRLHDPILDNAALWLPAVIVVLASLRSLRLNLHELHHGLLALNAGRAMSRVIVEWLKNRVSSSRFQTRRRADLRLLNRLADFVPTFLNAAPTLSPSRPALASSSTSPMLGVRFLVVTRRVHSNASSSSVSSSRGGTVSGLLRSSTRPES